MPLPLIMYHLPHSSLWDGPGDIPMDRSLEPQLAWSTGRTPLDRFLPTRSTGPSLPVPRVRGEPRPEVARLGTAGSQQRNAAPASDPSTSPASSYDMWAGLDEQIQEELDEVMTRATHEANIMAEQQVTTYLTSLVLPDARGADPPHSAAAAPPKASSSSLRLSSSIAKARRIKPSCGPSHVRTTTRSQGLSA